MSNLRDGPRILHWAFGAVCKISRNALYGMIRSWLGSWPAGLHHLASRSAKLAITTVA